MERRVRGGLLLAFFGIVAVWLSRRRAPPRAGTAGEPRSQPTASEVKSYAGYVVLKAEPQTLAQLDALTKKAFASLSIAVDFWQEARAVGAPVILMLEGGDAAQVAQNYLGDVGVTFHVMIPDVQAAIDASQSPRAAADSSELSLGQYHSYGEITAWMEHAASTLDGVEVIEIGPTIEKRKVKGLQINIGESFAPKPIIFLVCGMHAREWIAPAACLYAAHQLAHGLAEESTKAFEWHIVPSLNADGYEYSRTHDRFWRKNRRHLSYLCGYGVDLERNFNWRSCQEDDEQFCLSQAYCGGKGAKPSEPETINLVRYLNDLGAANRRVEGFVDIHSFSQLWMWPWGYTMEPVPAADSAVQAQCGNAAAEALYKVHNTSFITGPIASTIYEVGGSSVDWTYGRLGIAHSYAVELRDKGEYGFLLPEDQIIPTGEELLAGLTSMAACIADTLGTPELSKLVSV